MTTALTACSRLIRYQEKEIGAAVGQALEAIAGPMLALGMGARKEKLDTIMAKVRPLTARRRRRRRGSSASFQLILC